MGGKVHKIREVPYPKFSPLKQNILRELHLIPQFSASMANLVTSATSLAKYCQTCHFTPSQPISDASAFAFTQSCLCFHSSILWSPWLSAGLALRIQQRGFPRQQGPSLYLPRGAAAASATRLLAPIPWNCVWVISLRNKWHLCQRKYK